MASVVVVTSQSGRPADVTVLQWTDRTAFARLRAEWLELLRRDPEINGTVFLVVAEVAGRMAWDTDGAWPSISRLAADVAKSAPTIKRCLAKATSRGWLTSARRGFAASNLYRMACSKRIAEEVFRDHDERLAVNAARKAGPATSAIGITYEPPLGSLISPHSDHFRSVIGLASDPLILPSIPPSELPPTNPKKRLSGADALGAKVIELLGEGDPVKGEQVAQRLGAAQVARLAEHVQAVGEGRAAEAIRSAIGRSVQAAPSSPVIVLADAVPAAPNGPTPKHKSKSKPKPKPNAAQADLFADLGLAEHGSRS